MARGNPKFSITATDRTRGAFNSVQKNIGKTQGLQRSWNAGLNSNRRAVQQFGFQMSDFAVQIAGGQSAMLAFTQQGGQMLQFFGPAGAIAAAFLAVFGSLAIAFTRSGKALSDLTPILGVLQEDFAAIGRGLSVVKEIMIDFANVVLNNMDRILITIATVAGLMAGRWVVAFVAARVATFTLVGALTALRVALIRTGIGALVVGAGELVYQFTRLVKAAGGLGEAFGQLFNVAKSVFIGIGTTARGLVHILAGVASSIAGSFVRAFAYIAKTWDALINGMVTGWNAIAGTSFGETLGMGLMGKSDISGTLGNTADELFGNAVESIKKGGGLIKEAGQGVADEVKKIGDIVRSFGDDDANIDIRDWFNGGDADTEGGGGKGGKGGKSIVDKMKERAEEIKKIYEDMTSTIKDGLSSTFKSLFDKTKSFSSAARDALGSILDKVADMILDPVWDMLAKTISKALIGTPDKSGTSLVGGLFSSLLGSFDGGGYTGQGSRSGGMDGKGGRLAMLHPRESIIDHTKSSGSATSGGSANGTVVIRLADGLKAEMFGEMQGIAIETVNNKTPGIVGQSVAQAGKMNRETKQYSGL